MSTEKTTNEFKSLTDEFDLLLKKELEGQFPYLDDNGFSNRVVEKITPKKTANAGLITKLPLMISGLIALIVFSYFPWRDLLLAGYSLLLTVNLTDLLAFSLVFFISSIITVSYWGIFTKE